MAAEQPVASAGLNGPPEAGIEPQPAFAIIAVKVANGSRFGRRSAVRRQDRPNPGLFSPFPSSFSLARSLLPFFFLPQLLTEPMLLSKRGRGKEGWGGGERGSDKARKRERGWIC